MNGLTRSWSGDIGKGRVSAPTTRARARGRSGYPTRPRMYSPIGRLYSDTGVLMFSDKGETFSADPREGGRGALYDASCFKRPLLRTIRARM